MSPKWEYAQLYFVPGRGQTREIRLPGGEVRSNFPGDWNAIVDICNSLGAEGWELVVYNFLTPGGVFFFKRPAS